MIEFFEQHSQSGNIDFRRGAGVAIKHEPLAGKVEEVERRWGSAGREVGVAMAGVACWILGARLQARDADRLGRAA